MAWELLFRLCALFLLSSVSSLLLRIGRFMERKHHINVTEIFRVLNAEKKYRMIKLSLYLSIFVIIIYKIVMSAVILLMDVHEVESGIF
ncbi:protein cornichon homolog 1-like isoform X2 [Asparagus officinalis]|uniref:protein cornichon homolog 1-like isoform X2 n=1 Tax=Asparagus officinalis TaxID=4686 RepID=UPI00098E5FB0|nr:protein cornichon homolog 1-like isoform X2 [Asparagus officinalis]